MDHKQLSIFGPHAVQRASSKLPNLKRKRIHKPHPNHRNYSLLTYKSFPPLTVIRLDFDLPKRMEVLTTIAGISHTFGALRKTSTFPAGPLDRDPHSSTLHLAYNAQSNAYNSACLRECAL